MEREADDGGVSTRPSHSERDWNLAGARATPTLAVLRLYPHTSTDTYIYAKGEGWREKERYSAHEPRRVDGLVSVSHVISRCR